MLSCQLLNAKCSRIKVVFLRAGTVCRMMQKLSVECGEAQVNISCLLCSNMKGPVERRADQLLPVLAQDIWFLKWLVP